MKNAGSFLGNSRKLRGGTRFGFHVLLVLSALICLHAVTARSADRQEQAAELKQQLLTKILPYWYDTTLDRTNGGYLLADDGTGEPQSPKTKMLVSQSRMIWGFSHAWRRGLRDDKRDYLQAARQGFDFLEKHFRDSRNGGYFWTTDLAGTPVNRNKIVYGQTFVIYGLIEYHRASGSQEALKRALELYHVLQKNAHDHTNRGWMEHFTEDWKPTSSPGEGAMVEVPGYKSANTHLHLMEALTELYQATRDSDVRHSLEETLEINTRYFYPPIAGDSSFHRKPDWSPVKDPSSAGLSYGHNVEFAWLMLRAQQALMRPLDRSHFNAHLNHALKHGYDHTRGGVYALGLDDQPAHKTEKVWWVQAEMLAALVVSLQHEEDEQHAAALDSLLRFIKRYQADSKDGIWFSSVTAEGTPKDRSKAHAWKANYHDLRALIMFIDAFGN